MNIAGMFGLIHRRRVAFASDRPIGQGRVGRSVSFRYRAWESYVGGSAYASDMTDMPTERRSPWRVVSRRAWSTILFVCGALLEAIGAANIPGLYAPEGSEAGGLVAAYWLVALMAWGSVFVRDRWPLAAVIAGAALALAGSSYLLLLIGLHHMMLRSAARRVAMLAAIAAFVVAASILRDVLTPWGDGLALMLSARSAWVLPVVFGVLSLGGLASFTALARSRHSGDEQRRRAERERERVTHLGEEVARRSERERIAREVHDSLANRLSVVALQGGVLEMAVEAHDPRAIDIARELRREASRGLDDLRGLLGQLHDASSGDGSTQTASMKSIRELVRSARATGATIDALVMVDGTDRVAAVLDRTVYRLVQEALTNAMKHADGAPVSIFVEASPDAGVRVRVSNPLRDASTVAAHGASAGVVGMRERVETLGGEAWIGAHEREFIVDVSFPWLEVEPA